MKLFECEVTGHIKDKPEKEHLYTAVAEGDFDAQEENPLWGLTVDKVIFNGEEKTDFGQSWAGYPLKGRNFGQSHIAAYFNDDMDFEFTYVCDEIKQWKESLQSYTHKITGHDVVDRQVPDFVVNPSGDMAELIALTQNIEGYVSCFYSDEYGDVTILAREDGSIATDIDAFYINALVDSAEKEDILFMADDIRIWLREAHGINTDDTEERKHSVRASAMTDIISRKVFDTVHKEVYTAQPELLPNLSNDRTTMGMDCDTIVGDFPGRHVFMWSEYQSKEGDGVFVLYGDGFVTVVHGTRKQEGLNIKNLDIKDSTTIYLDYSDKEDLFTKASDVADAVVAYFKPQPVIETEDIPFK